MVQSAILTGLPERPFAENAIANGYTENSLFTKEARDSISLGLALVRHPANCGIHCLVISKIVMPLWHHVCVKFVHKWNT